MGETTSDYRAASGVLEFRDDTTSETVLPCAPVLFYDDFIRKDLLLAETGSQGLWEDVVVGSATVSIPDNVSNGVLQLTLDTTDEGQDAVAYFGNVRMLDLNNKLQWECRATTSASVGGTTTVVMGMAGDHNLAKDSVTEHAWFRLQFSQAVIAETDDTATDNDDVSTGHSITNGTYDIYRIDFSDLSDVRFYINGSRVASGTTFDMSTLTAAEARMQPYFSIDKPSDTGAGTLLVDYVRIWSTRG